MATALLNALLQTLDHKLIPLARERLTVENAPFGGAVLLQSDLSPVTVSYNACGQSPLLHGETNCIREFFLNPPETRPDTKKCIFFATHEPCSLCLSGIAWTGFPLVYYLYTYEETRDLLGIGEDIEIIEEVFRVRAPSDSDESLAARPWYNKQNKFFSIKSMAELVEEVGSADGREVFKKEIQRVKDVYDGFCRDWVAMQPGRPGAS